MSPKERAETLKRVFGLDDTAGQAVEYALAAYGRELLQEAAAKALWRGDEYLHRTLLGLMPADPIKRWDAQ